MPKQSVQANSQVSPRTIKYLCNVLNSSQTPQGGFQTNAFHSSPSEAHDYAGYQNPLRTGAFSAASRSINNLQEEEEASSTIELMLNPLIVEKEDKLRQLLDPEATSKNRQLKTVNAQDKMSQVNNYSGLEAMRFENGMVVNLASSLTSVAKLNN